MGKPLFRYQDGRWPNGLAMGYVVFGYACGMAMIMAQSWYLDLPGVLLLGHSMVIAAYLIHECAHNTIFSNATDNERLGRLLNWVTGGCYGDYAALQHKHFRHHVDKADVVAFDYRPGLRRHPLLLVLNFSYHNAHHFKQALPWHQLPALHDKLYGDDDSQLIPFRNQLASYHRNRVARIDNDVDEHPRESADKGRDFVGVVGVNFLTAF